MKNLRQRTLIAAIFSTCTACGLGFQMATPAMAQFTTTLTDPYAPGVYITPPNAAVGYTPPPPIGCGPVAPGVTPGQSGPASLMPWVPYLPANTIDQSSSYVSMPSGPSSLNEPYTLGLSMQGSIPAPPSAPGAIPTILQTPQGSSPYAAQVTVPTGGVLPDGSAPTARSGRQFTQNFGLQGTNTSYVTDFGIQPSQNPNANLNPPPQVTYVGPTQCTYPGQYSSTFPLPENSTPYLPNAFQVNMGTGDHTLFQGTGTQPATQIIAPY